MKSSNPCFGAETNVETPAPDAPPVEEVPKPRFGTDEVDEDDDLAKQMKALNDEAGAAPSGGGQGTSGRTTSMA